MHEIHYKWADCNIEHHELVWRLSPSVSYHLVNGEHRVNGRFEIETLQLKWMNTNSNCTFTRPSHFDSAMVTFFLDGWFGTQFRHLFLLPFASEPR